MKYIVFVTDRNGTKTVPVSFTNKETASKVASVVLNKVTGGMAEIIQEGRNEK